MKNVCCGNETGEIELADYKIGSNPKDEITKKTFWQHCKYYFREYCLEGTLHGIKYIGENRTVFEKIWWLVSIIISLCFCIFLVLKAYDKWENSPVIVSFATKETPTWQVPFPAVTICPETKSAPKVFNYSKYLDMKKRNEVLNPEDEKKFSYMSLICEYHSDLNYSSHKFAGDDIFDFFDEVQPKFLDNISECKFFGIEQKCSDLFFPVITDEGVCYTFNLLDREEIFKDNVLQYKNYHSAPKSGGWSIENGYPKTAGIHTYPRRALFAGAIFGLEAKLSIHEDEIDYKCGSSIQGYKIQVSHPSRMPRVKQQHFQVPLDTMVLTAIAPDMTTTSDAVRRYESAKRNCYFPTENHLEYFKVYTQQNCQIECKTRYTQYKCGCTHFYMPRNGSMKVCSAGSLKCIKDAENEVLFEGITQKIDTFNGMKIEMNDEKSKLFHCDCLPICTSMYYIVENSLTHWDWRQKYKKKDDESSEDYNKKHMSYFQIFFKGNQFITLDRSELYGYTDFFANFGGLLGLFVGFSLLSLIEVVYYLTLRIICNIAMFGRNNWSGKK